MKYSANYDKYPFVQVSYNSDDCISGWFAITDSISERLKVLEKPLKVVAIECYQGVFENDIRNAFAGRFNNALLFIQIVRCCRKRKSMIFSILILPMMNYSAI